MGYTHYSQALQEPTDENFDAVNILDIAEELPREVSPQNEVDAFWSRLTRENPTHLKWAIISHWQDGSCDANEAIFWLRTMKILKRGQGPAGHQDPEAFMKLYVARERRKAEGGA